MSSRLDSKPQIWTLASDLGLSVEESPTRSILQSVGRRITRIARAFRCASLGELLVAAAGELGTIFEEIHSDSELQRICSTYLRKGEKCFANLANELKGPQDYAITYRRGNREEWEPQFVSVIDCRGDKSYRSYFSKWHELAHLLTLTPQMRLVFRRTHSGSSARDAEEILMDVIAGEAGFFPDFLHTESSGDVSFDSIRQIRAECCPEASAQAATIGIVKALPVPCILLEARVALRAQESADSLQMGFGFGAPAPTPVLRAVHVTVNDSSRENGIRLFRNWRVPNRSVISRVFADGGYSESIENLDWWVASSGSRLSPCPVTVKARKVADSVQALLIPHI